MKHSDSVDNCRHQEWIDDATQNTNLKSNSFGYTVRKSDTLIGSGKIKIQEGEVLEQSQNSSFDPCDRQRPLE
jgi:hypothetical protein